MYSIFSGITTSQSNAIGDASKDKRALLSVGLDWSGFDTAWMREPSVVRLDRA